MPPDARVTIRTIAVESPCREDWSRMTGDDAVRHCGVCKSNVFNLSAMSDPDVEALLARGQDVCVRYYSRPDGTLVRTKCDDKPTRAPSTVAAGIAATLATSTAFVALDVATDRGSDHVADAAEGPVLVAMGGIKLTVKASKRSRPARESAPEPAPEAPISDAGRMSLSAAEPVECSDPWGCAPGAIGTRQDVRATTALSTASVSRSPWRGIAYGAIALLVGLLAILTRRRWSVGEPR